MIHLNSANPCYIIFLVDQSGAMGEPLSGGRTKSDLAAMYINQEINELIVMSMNGDRVSDRAFISIIGYGGNSVDDVRSDYLSSFADAPIRIEQNTKKVADGTGGIVEVNIQQPIFVDPIYQGSTNSGEGFELCSELANSYQLRREDSPPPVIIHLTSGFSSDWEQMLNVSNEIKKKGGIIINILVDENDELKWPTLDQVYRRSFTDYLLFEISSFADFIDFKRAEIHGHHIKSTSKLLFKYPTNNFGLGWVFHTGSYSNYINL